MDLPKKKIVVLKITIPDHIRKSDLKHSGGSKDPKHEFHKKYAKEMFDRLHHLYRKEKAIFSVEITSLNGVISYYLSCPFNLRAATESYLYYYFPNLTIEQVEDYTLTEKANIRYYGAEITLLRSPIFPITHRNKKKDPLTKIFEALHELNKNEVGTFQIILEPINGESLVYKWWWSLKKRLTLLRRKNKFCVRKIYADVIDQKANAKHFSSTVRIVFRGTNKVSLKGKVGAFIENLKEFTESQMNGLVVRKTNTKINIIKRYVYRRQYFPYPLSIDEIVSLYHFRSSKKEAKKTTKKKTKK